MLLLPPYPYHPTHPLYTHNIMGMDHINKKTSTVNVGIHRQIWEGPSLSLVVLLIILVIVVIISVIESPIYGYHVLTTQGYMGWYL